jgi:hypothetical protein
MQADGEVPKQFHDVVLLLGPRYTYEIGGYRHRTSAVGQADGILMMLINQKATHRLLQAGFGVGIERFKRVSEGVVRSAPGGANKKAYGQAGVQRLADFVQQLPQEIGYPCGHRRQMSYFNGTIRCAAALNILET